MNDPDYDAAMKVRREVLGDEHVDRAVSETTSFTAPVQDLITRYAWGDVWARPGLDRRTRSCVTLAVLAALQCEDEIPMHVRAALRHGVTREEIQEILLHTAVYAGVRGEQRVRGRGLAPTTEPPTASRGAGPSPPDVARPSVSSCSFAAGPRTSPGCGTSGEPAIAVRRMNADASSIRDVS